MIKFKQATALVTSVLLSGLAFSTSASQRLADESPLTTQAGTTQAGTTQAGTTQAGTTQAMASDGDCQIELMPSSDKIDEIWLETDLYADKGITCKVQRIAAIALKLKKLVIIMTPTNYDINDFCPNKNDGITNRLKWYQSNIITPLKKINSSVQFGLMPYSPKKFGRFITLDGKTCNIWGVPSDSPNESAQTLKQEALAVKMAKRYGFAFWATQQSYSNYQNPSDFQSMVGGMPYEIITSTSFTNTNDESAYAFGQAYNFFIHNPTAKPSGFTTTCKSEAVQCDAGGEPMGCDTSEITDGCHVNPGAVSSIYLLPFLKDNPVPVANVADYINQLILEKAGSEKNCTGIALSGEIGPAFFGSWRGCVSGHEPSVKSLDCDITNTYKAKFSDFFDSMRSGVKNNAKGCSSPVRIALWNIDNFLADPKPK